MSKFRDFDWKKYGGKILSHGMHWEGDMLRGTAKNFTIHVSFYGGKPEEVFGPYKNFDRAYKDRMYLWKQRWEVKEKNK